MTGGRHRLCIEPLDLPDVQKIQYFSVQNQPEAFEKSEYLDFFGNRTQEMFFQDALKELSFKLVACVERVAPKNPKISINFVELENAIANFQNLSALSPHHFLGNSERISLLSIFKEFSLKFIVEKTYCGTLAISNNL